ncbi:MAG: oligosaccharide flippase family protein [Vicinamibacteria bacterium]|nr:oligosaccharide flippase family protein [Vicinamibacteria bacterium]
MSQGSDPSGSEPEPLAAKTGSKLRRLAGLSVAYGTADVLAQGINLLLLPLYTSYLTPADYGALALLLLLSTFLKILFRAGLDSGFMRIHYDLEDPEAKARFAGTVALFSGALSTLGFALFWLFSPTVSRALLGSPEQTLWVRLVAFDLLASSFAFVPLTLLRIEERAKLFSTYSLTRHATNTVLKVVLVTAGFGVSGVLVSDAAASVVLSLGLVWELRSRARWAFDWPPLREALRFGLPKVPHGLLVQALNLADRRILDAYVSRAEVGVYQMGSNFASAMKFPLSAFEPAWQPFVFDHARRENGARDIGLVASRMCVLFIGVAVTLSLILPDLLRIVIQNVEYHGAAPVAPILVLASLFQGLFLLSSIGISISKEARYYPMITAAAAALNISLNFWLVPGYGVMAASWATVAGYALMALLGAIISRKLYPIPMQWPRIAGAFGAGVVFFLLGTLFEARPSGVLPRVGLAIAFDLFVWRAVFDETDRTELRKVVNF